MTDENLPIVYHEDISESFHTRGRICSILQPAGLYYNTEVARMVRGDRFRLFRDVIGTVLEVTEVNMQTKVFGALCRWIYGENITPKRIIDTWQHRAVVQGNKRSAVSLKKCFLLRYYVDDESQSTPIPTKRNRRA